MIDTKVNMNLMDLPDIEYNSMDMSEMYSPSPNSIQLRTHPTHNSINFSELGKKLLEASRNGATDEVKDLINNGAPFTTDWLGASGLHYAAQYGHDETVACLLTSGIAKDARTKIERTALHVAAQEGHLETVTVLVEFGVDIDAKDMLKMTPLHWAVQRGHRDVVEYLLNNGADVTIANKFEKTPIDIAYNNGHVDYVSLLQSFKGRAKPKLASSGTPSQSKNVNKYPANRNRFKALQIGTPSTPKNSLNISIKKEADETEMAIKSLGQKNLDGRFGGKKDNFLPNVITNGQSFTLTETGKAMLNSYAKDINKIPTGVSKKVSNLIVLTNTGKVDAKTINNAAAKNIQITGIKNTKLGGDKFQLLTKTATPTIKRYVINPNQPEKDEEIRKLKRALEEYKGLIISKDLEIERLRKKCRASQNSNHNQEDSGNEV